MLTGLVEDTGVVVAADRTAGASYAASPGAGASGASGAPPGARPSAAFAVGERVHLEADILAKHVEKLVKP